MQDYDSLSQYSVPPIKQWIRFASTDDLHCVTPMPSAMPVLAAQAYWCHFWLFSLLVSRLVVAVDCWCSRLASKHIISRQASSWVSEIPTEAFFLSQYPWAALGTWFNLFGGPHSSVKSHKRPKDILQREALCISKSLWKSAVNISGSLSEETEVDG